MLKCLMTFLVQLVHLYINGIFLVGGSAHKIPVFHFILEAQHPKVRGFEWPLLGDRGRTAGGGGVSESRKSAEATVVGAVSFPGDPGRGRVFTTGLGASRADPRGPDRSLRELTVWGWAARGPRAVAPVCPGTSDPSASQSTPFSGGGSASRRHPGHM